MVRPSVPSQTRVAFWRAVRSGLSVQFAAAAVGVSRPTAYRWFGQAGGVIPRAARSSASQSSSRLSFLEREEIAVLTAAGSSARQIAQVLGRAPSTVSRELSRNRTGSGYRATVAQAATDRRGRRPKARKLEQLALRREVRAMLRKRRSPEQIAGRLRADHPDDPEMQVSHETIYQALYVQGRGSLRAELSVALRTGRALRRPRKPEPASKHTAITGKVMISERPAEIEDRAVPGHWEGDLILGSTTSGSAIGTLVERATGFVLLLHLPGDHTSRTVADAMIAKMSELPEQLRRSLTWDQGSEMAKHHEITMATGMDIYFCDPHSPWQRGSNENTNGLLRQYFPKGTDLSTHGPGILDNVAAEMNDRPRKRHHYRTPAEVLSQLLSQEQKPPRDALTA
ncbi:MAG: IS30 family transposase [Proteobacteria bacterium]|nr:IS30 family transposase [Pseudomonadota bacterium]